MISMLDQFKLSEIAQELSSTPCPECGGFHDVELNVRKGTVHLDVVSYKFPNGVCNGFKELVKSRLNNSRHLFTKPLLP